MLENLELCLVSGCTASVTLHMARFGFWMKACEVTLEDQERGRLGDLRRRPPFPEKELLPFPPGGNDCRAEDEHPQADQRAEG